jgi:molybdate transport system substrate-binding protein
VKRSLLIAPLALAALAGAGCGNDDNDQGVSSKPVVTVSAAASLTEAFNDLKKNYSAADLRFSFAGSDELAAQIRKGATPDVFAAANTKLPDALAKEGLVEKPVVFATNELVLAVPVQGAEVSSLDDLQKPGTKLAIGDKSVPVGEYTRKVLSGLPASEEKAILANVRSEEPDVKGVVGKVSQGAVDAGFVYKSDVDAASGKLKAISLPKKLKPQVAYGVAVVKEAEEPKAAQAFVQSLLNGQGKTALRGAAIGPPPP